MPNIKQRLKTHLGGHLTNTSIQLMKNIAMIGLILLSLPARATITITQIQALKYPSVIKNLTRSTTVTVNWKGRLGNSTNATLLDNDYHQGRYLVTSDTNSPIIINFFQLANETKINLKTLRVRYKNKTYKGLPVADLDNPGLNGEYVDIGAKVVAGKNSTAGQKYPQYTLTIEEQ
ncbi:hypothetical protein [Shewanella psychropiezotolerans]|uniref:hypothetical protein n=1 Tax=Shewanella psychropiezotolerans TaxID=2593655 RepID=UPI00163D84E3|nr:hypothetical protein [Shewanella psychropiezotolerans]